MPVNGVGRISYGHYLYHASPVCLITCILFHQLSSFSFATAHFKFQSLHYHIFIFFPQNMSLPPYTTCFLPSCLKTPLCPTCPSTPRCFFDLIASHHICSFCSQNCHLFFSQAPCFTSIQHNFCKPSLSSLMKTYLPFEYFAAFPELHPTNFCSSCYRCFAPTICIQSVTYTRELAYSFHPHHHTVFWSLEVLFHASTFLASKICI